MRELRRNFIWVVSWISQLPQTLTSGVFYVTVWDEVWTVLGECLGSMKSSMMNDELTTI